MRAPPPEGQRADGGDGVAYGAGRADPRVERHVAELRGRLRPVCREWPEAEFDALVQRIARTKVRWNETGL